MLGLPDPVKTRNLFLVKFAVKQGLMLLAKKLPFMALKISSPLMWIVGLFAEKFLYLLVDAGILILDIALMEKRVNLEEKDYKKAIYDAYVGAKKKVLTEEQKKELRQNVIDATRKFVRVKVRTSK